MKISGTSRRARIVTLTFAMGAFLAIPSWAQQKRAITVGEAKGLPFSDGIVVGNTLYIAGTEGTDESNKLKPGGIGPETQAALENIQKVVRKAGFAMEDIVSVTVYLADIKEFSEMNKVYKSVMPDPKPTRATVQAAGLVNDARIEISAIAIKTKK
ncbi:MAG: RidA family protein [Acidobacteria bacterium]|nr:RidA family protein [Acidobacteriota bacterium]